MRIKCPYCGREFEVKCGGGMRGRPRKEIDINRIRRLLKTYNNKSVVARLLGISRPTLYKILKEYGLT